MDVRVYTNADGTEFIKAENDEYFQEDALEDLTNDGIHIYPENDYKQE